MEKDSKNKPAPAPGILKIAPYVPGKPIEELEREYNITGSIKLASNENPLGPPPSARLAMEKALAGLNRYPDGAAFELTRALSRKLGRPKEEIVLGNGSDEIILMLCMAYLMPGDEAVMSDPSFLMYEILAHASCGVPVMKPLQGKSLDLAAMAAAVTDKTRLVFLTNPNNPTGSIITKTEMDTFLDKIPGQVIVVVDEAYIEFGRDKNLASGLDYLEGEKTVVTLRTFSKAYGLAGLRVGYGVMPPQVADTLQRIRLPFNTNLLAQVGARAALEDEAYLEESLAVVHSGLDYLYEQCQRLGLSYTPSQANFFMIHLNQTARPVFEALLAEGVIVRDMASYGFPEHLRVSVGLAQENQRFIKALEKVLKRA